MSKGCCIILILRYTQKSTVILHDIYYGRVILYPFIIVKSSILFSKSFTSLVKCKAVHKLTDMSQDNTNASQGMQQTSTQWAEIIGQLFDRLTGKGASVTYTFDNLVIDMPRAQGPNGQNMGSAKWTVNGKVVITAEAHQASEVRQQQKPSLSTTA
jgi:hypothetical protein